jgi:gas vesicle protein
MYDQYPPERGTGGLWTTIRQNPVPAALAAIGLGMLWSKRASASEGSRRTRDTRYGHDQAQPIGKQVVGQAQQVGEHVKGQAQQVGEHVVEQAQQVAGQVQELPGHVVGQVQQVAGQMQVQVQERAGQVQQQAQGLWQMLESNPVAMGGLGVVLGGVAGLLLPETQTENQLLGETREKVLDRVQELAGETVATVQHVAEEASSAAMEAGQAAIDELSAPLEGSSDTEKSGSGKRGSGSGSST